MTRNFLLILLLLISCSRDSSTADHYNQKETEYTSSELSSDTQNSVEPNEGKNVDIQSPRTEGSLKSTIFSFIFKGTIILLFTVAVYLKRKQYKEKISKLEFEYKLYFNKYKNLESNFNKLKQENLCLKEKRRKTKPEKKVSQSDPNSISGDSDVSFNESNYDEVDGGLHKYSYKEGVSLGNEEEIFFTVPNENGKFSHESGISFFEDKRLYKVTYRRGEPEGILEFIPSKYDGIAINHKNSMIKSACSITKENEFNPSSVRQISPGKVKRDGKEWIIEDKIKVEIL